MNTVIEKELPEHILKAISERMGTINFYPGRDEGFTSKQMTLIVEKGLEGYYEACDEHEEHGRDYMDEIILEAVKEHIDNDEINDWIADNDPDYEGEDDQWEGWLGIDGCDVRDSLRDRDLIQYSTNMDTMLDNMDTMYLVLKTTFELPYGGHELYDIHELLTSLKINPSLIEDEWEDSKQVAEDALVDIDLFIDTLNNSYYGGNLYIMMDDDIVKEMAKHPADYWKGKEITVKKGGHAIFHNYGSGASGVEFKLTKDWVLGAGQLEYFLDDGSNKYGIQSCCCMTQVVWNSEIVIEETKQQGVK